MFMHVQRLINEIVPDEPDPAAANALQEGLGGQFGEMRTMMQYLFQSINFRGPAGKPYKDLLQGIGTEEISHVELIGTTIARLLDGSPQYKGKATDPLDEPGKGGATPLEIALDHSNIHHYLVGAQGALPVDAAGNPWSGSYVYNCGNLVLDLLYNLMLESTGRLQKCRIYEMTDNKTARSTIAYLIVRDQAHENAYAKALETPRRQLGQDAADPEDQRRAVPRGQEAARPGAAAQAVHVQRGQPVRGRQGLPRRRAGVDGRRRARPPTSRPRASRWTSPSSGPRSSRRGWTPNCSRWCRPRPSWSSRTPTSPRSRRRSSGRARARRLAAVPEPSRLDIRL